MNDCSFESPLLSSSCLLFGEYQSRKWGMAKLTAQLDGQEHAGPAGKKRGADSRRRKKKRANANNKHKRQQPTTTKHTRRQWGKPTDGDHHSQKRHRVGEWVVYRCPTNHGPHRPMTPQLLNRGLPPPLQLLRPLPHLRSTYNNVVALPLTAVCTLPRSSYWSCQRGQAGRRTGR